MDRQVGFPFFCSSAGSEVCTDMSSHHLGCSDPSASCKNCTCLNLQYYSLGTAPHFCCVQAKKRLDSHAVLSNRERLETLQEIDEIDRQQEFFVEKLETPKTTSRKFDGKFWGDKHLNSGVTQEDLATWYDRTDKRSDVDKLTDYMSILAAYVVQ